MRQSSSPEDPYDLRRFLDAQQSSYEQALRELRSGHKRTHWMWFIFPQILGLGHSAMAERFGITGAEEARAYAAHPILGDRLRQCTQAVLAVPDRSLEQIFGFPDHLKFHSCVTLFAAATRPSEAAPLPGIYSQALDQCFAGRPDQATLALLERSPSLDRSP